MNKKSLAILAIALVLVGAGLVVRELTTQHKEVHEELSQARVVDVDAVVGDPEQFTGFIGVEGSVTNCDEAGSTFALGCEDACILMPVKYAGHLPKEGANVIVYGEIKKTDEAKFIFFAREIASK